jgi:hypothetical protein
MRMRSIGSICAATVRGMGVRSRARSRFQGSVDLKPIRVRLVTGKPALGEAAMHSDANNSEVEIKRIVSVLLISMEHWEWALRLKRADNLGQPGSRQYHR